MTEPTSLRIDNAAHHVEALVESLEQKYIDDGYQAQSFEIADEGLDGVVLQVAAKSGIRAATGLSLAATAKITRSDSAIIFHVYGAEWLDKVISGGIGTLVFAPTLVTSLVGAWKQKKLLTRLQTDINATVSNLKMERDEISLKEWWKLVDSKWKSSFRKKLGIDYDPSEDELTHLVATTEFNCATDQMETLSPLKMFTQLEKLECAPNLPRALFTSLAPLRRASALRYLDCRNSNVSTLEPIRDLTDLEYLDVSGTKISSLSPLKHLVSLRTVKLRATPQVTSIEPLSDLPNIEHIDIRNNPAIPRAEVKTFKRQHTTCKVRRVF